MLGPMVVIHGKMPLLGSGTTDPGCVTRTNVSRSKERRTPKNMPVASVAEERGGPIWRFTYPLVFFYHSYGKSPFSMDKSTINGNFP